LSALERVAVIGTGSVARSQLPALQAVRPVEEIRVFSRNAANRSEFIDEMRDVVDARFVDCFDPIVCDSVELGYEQAGDAVAAVERGLDPDRSRSLGSLVAGLHPGRTAPEQLTLFKSTGTGLQDLALASAVLEIADARNLGVEVGETLTLKRFGATGRT
jgi:ornithine cyclodeaminase/alanine dehydrogenase-like protein (mu-crystallin family)